jgi:hypothetical protein
VDRFQSRIIPPALSWSLAVVFVFSVPAHVRASQPGDLGLGPREQDALYRYARDTWQSFEAMAMPSGLPADGLQLGDDGAWQPISSTTPTNIEPEEFTAGSDDANSNPLH